VLPLSHHLLGGRWIPSAPGSAAVRAAIEPSFARGALDPKRPRVGSSALLLPAEEDIFQLCTPEPLLRGRHQDSKKVYSHGAVLGTLWFSDQVAAFITVQLDHNLRKTSSGPSLTVSVTRLLGSRTGEPALPPALCLNVCCAHRALHVSLVGRPARH